MNNKKRCAIYLYYDRRGIFEEYAQEAVKGLAAVAERVLVVVNGLLDTKGENYIKENGYELLVRENKGYDFGGYKDGIEHIGYEELKNYDELVILNSSVFGPVRPLPEVFAAMDMKNPNCDFWGITLNKLQFPVHIQSYFYVFRKRILNSETFKNFWQGLKYFKNKIEAIECGETQLTKYFFDHGYVYGSLIEPTFDFFFDQCLDGARHILKSGSPFVKVSLFSAENAYGTLLRGGTTELSLEIFNLLDDGWKDIVSKHLCSSCKQSIFSHLKRHILVIDDKIRNKNNETKNVAAIIYVCSKENIDLILNYINNFPSGSCIYFVSSQEDVLSIYKEKTKDDCLKDYEYRLQSDCDGYETAYWIVCRDVYNKHKYICLLNDNKSANPKPYIIGRGFLIHELESLVASKQYINNLIEELDNNPKIGLVQPPITLQDFYMNDALYCPTENENSEIKCYVQKIIKELSISLDFDEEMFFPIGGSFWARSEALKVMFRKKWNIEDFPKEPVFNKGTILQALERIYPIIVQEAGFYTFVAMPNSYAKGYYYNSEYRLKEMFRAKYEIYLQKESLAADIRALINERNVLTKNNAALTNERDVANKRLYNIQNSLSFKIGRLVTLIPRMIRNFIRGE